MQKIPQPVLLEAKEAFAFLDSGEVLSMPLSRPMPSVWPRCHELRFNDKQGTYRILYVVIISGANFIPHCFQKKT
jgi:phage-related protein